MLTDPYPASVDALHPADQAQLAEFARGAISAREFARRVIRRMGVEIPSGLKGDRDSSGEQTPSVTMETMSDDTQAFARGELDVAGWLSRAERKYGN